MLAALHASLSRGIIAVLAVTFAMPVPAFSEASEVSASSLAAELGIDPEYVPPEMGQTPLEVYVPETGHSVRGYMLDYWRANGAETVYGNPISEPFGADNGLYSQAFERGIFQFSPHWMWTDDPAVRLMPIGRQEIKEDRLATRSDDRRTGSDRRAATWRPDTESVQRVAGAGDAYSGETGFSVSGEFQEWYDLHEGVFYMGEPISEPHRERGVRVQYYENGVLMLQDGAVRPAPLPREAPEKYGIDTSPIAQGDRPVFSESLFYQHENPDGVDPATITGPKRIDISVSDQVMRVYQGDTLVLESLISTGQEPNDTEVGFFHVRIKFEKQTMSGFTTETGEVVGLGGDGSVDGTQTAYTYEVEDVPHVLYFNYQAEALHGAYWHDNFGQRMSHGCVNQPLDVAAFVYDFAPLGTQVNVYE